MKTLELKGIKSLYALQAFHTLMLGLKMLPAYCGESYEEFYARVEQMDAASQEKLIREAALFVTLTKDELEALAHFAADPNGVRYTAANLNSLGPDQLFEIVVAVAVEISKIKVHFVTDSEKKKLSGSA
jgi:hypothetical protein